MSHVVDLEALMHGAKIDTNITLTLTRSGTNVLNWWLASLAYRKRTKIIKRSRTKKENRKNPNNRKQFQNLGRYSELPKGTSSYDKRQRCTRTDIWAFASVRVCPQILRRRPQPHNGTGEEPWPWQKLRPGLNITKHVAGEVQEKKTKSTIPVKITTYNWHSSLTCKARLQWGVSASTTKT